MGIIMNEFKILMGKKYIYIPVIILSFYILMITDGDIKSILDWIHQFEFLSKVLNIAILRITIQTLGALIITYSFYSGLQNCVSYIKLKSLHKDITILNAEVEGLMLNFKELLNIDTENINPLNTYIYMRFSYVSQDVNNRLIRIKKSYEVTEEQYDNILTEEYSSDFKNIFYVFILLTAMYIRYCIYIEQPVDKMLSSIITLLAILLLVTVVSSITNIYYKEILGKVKEKHLVIGCNMNDIKKNKELIK